MKNIVLIILLLLASTRPGNVQAQEVELLEKFIILDATENDMDITPQLLSNEAFLSLYTITGKEEVYFANVWPVAESQSSGVVYNAEFKEVAETEKAYATDEFSFSWSYQNSYDEKSGTAQVRILKIYKPQGVYFEAVVVPEDLDLLVYKGYVEGTLNLTAYDQ